MSVVKRGKKWCVVHGHPKKKGSKRDKPKGTVIKCFASKKKAQAMHTAIILSQKRRGRR
jgi:hypothetical protein